MRRSIDSRVSLSFVWSADTDTLFRDTMWLSITYFDTTFDARSIPPNVYAYQPDPEVAEGELVRKGWFVLGEAADLLQSALSLSSLSSLLVD